MEYVLYPWYTAIPVLLFLLWNHSFALSTNVFKPPELFLFTRSGASKSKREDPCRRVGVFQACSFRPPFSHFSSPPVLFLSLPLPSVSTLLAKYLSLGYKYKSHPLFGWGSLIVWLKMCQNTHKKNMWLTTCWWMMTKQIAKSEKGNLIIYFSFLNTMHKLLLRSTKATHFLHTSKIVNSYRSSHLQMQEKQLLWECDHRKIWRRHMNTS